MTDKAAYAVIGLGRFGSAIARTLAAMGYRVLAVDSRLPEVEAVGPHVAEAVQADATERAALAALHIERYPLVFNTIGDLTASILCTLALREQGVQRIIARINSQQQGRILARLGAEQILFPEQDMGERIARQVAAGPAAPLALDLGGDGSLLEMRAPAALAGRSLAAAQVRGRFGVTVVAVRRRSGADAPVTQAIVSPAAETIIGPFDLLLVAGRNPDLLRFQQAQP
ncbi:MAG: TrkA family potassium uptake protein [Gemmatimonadetes bacterium]|nr:TrkA family potassium uptake protein [Gemmatimonadota bacterium]